MEDGTINVMLTEMQHRETCMDMMAIHRSPTQDRPLQSILHIAVKRISLKFKYAQVTSQIKITFLFNGFPLLSGSRLNPSQEFKSPLLTFP